MSRLHVVLVAPEIAPNTGNIIRLCANAGAELHLVEPLGFSLDDRSLKRAGLDYHELASVHVHANFAAAATSLSDRRLFTFGSGHRRPYTDVLFGHGDVLVFGAERHGLSSDVAEAVPEAHQLTIPMELGNRSLNLANAVSVVVYEAWRQMGFTGADPGRGATTSETPRADPFDQ